MSKQSFGSFGLRLVQLYVLLSSSEQSYTLTRLSQMFRCSRQSILRMMEQLELLPEARLLKFKEGKDRHYRVETRFSTQDLSLDLETLRQLMLCRDIVRHLLPDPVHEEIGRALDNIAGKTQTASGNRRLDSYADAFWKGRIDYSPHQQTIQKLYSAIEKKRLCRVRYKAKLTDPVKEYWVAPIRILAFREALYARCFKCTAEGAIENDAPMTLAIHRIEKLMRLRTSVALPDMPAEEPHFGFWFNEPFQVRVRFRPEAATFVCERQWSADQRCAILPNDAAELTFTSTSRPEVKSWVMSFGATAELMAPEDLRAEIQAELLGAASQYNAGTLLASDD